MLLGLSLLVGCGGSADPLPADPDQLVLYSIDGPSALKREDDKAKAEGEMFHDWPVLGKVEIADPEQRRAIINAVNAATRDKSEVQAKCFIPRHAIRMVKGSETLDVVICFQCRNYERFPPRPLSGNHYEPIASSAQPLLDEALRNAGIPLAAKD